MSVLRNNVILIGIFLLLALTSSGKEFMMLDKKILHMPEIELNPYLYLGDNPDEDTVLFSQVGESLPINQSYTFSIHLKNSTSDRFARTIQFGERYVVVYNIHFQFSGKRSPKQFPGPANRVDFYLDGGEEAMVSFDVKELDRINPDKIHVRLFDPYALRVKTQRMYTTQAFFLGLLAFLSVFNLIIFLVTGWKLYLKYVLYIFCALVYFLYYYGFWQEWFPVTQEIPINIIYTWYSLIFISYFIFLNDFGNYKEYVPRAYQLLNIGIVFKSCETILNTILHFFKVEFIYTPLYIYSIFGFEIILMGFILFYIIKNKSVQGRLIILASVFLISGAILEQAKIIRNIDSTFFAQLGITCELLTFSAGLGYLTKRYYQEKRLNQELYIEQLKENDRIQKNINEQLEKKVKQRTLELQNEKELVEKKSKENELLMMEIHHRVKNNLQVIISLLNMQERTTENEDTRKALLSSKERIRAIELIHKMLYHQKEWQHIEMYEYISNLLQYCIDSHALERNQVETSINTEPLAIANTVAVPLGLILNELLVNSFKYAQDLSGKLVLSITLTEQENDLILLYKDNGNGKAEQLQKKGSLGFKIISIFVKQLNGEMEILDHQGLEYRIVIKNYKTVAGL